MLKKTLVVLAVLLVGFVVVVAMQPSSYRYERSATMAAPPSAVFEQVNDFHKWDAWSPWKALDPAAKTEHSGAPSGKGAVFSWDGNDEMGAGKMTILESRAPEHVQIDLEFFRPFAGKALTAFDLRADGANTHVTWSMAGENDFVCKAFSLFCDMDEMIGKDYDKGLAAIRAIVEKSPPQK